MDCSTPAQGGLTIPPGHIMVHNRWRGSELLKFIQSKVSIMFMDASDCVVDFRPSTQTAVVYLTESDIQTLTESKRRIAKLRRARGFTSHRVFFDKTQMTEQYFPEIQAMVVVEFGINIFPLYSQQEAGEMIVKMVLRDVKTPSRNPFRTRVSHGNANTDSAILQLVMLFPKVGDMKAKALLEKFKDIGAITEASTSELAKVVGISSAKHLKMFFDF